MLSLKILKTNNLQAIPDETNRIIIKTSEVQIKEETFIEDVVVEGIEITIEIIIAEDITIEEIIVDKIQVNKIVITTTTKFTITIASDKMHQMMKQL